MTASKEHVQYEVSYVDTPALQADLLQPIPEDWSYQQGAGFLVQGITAMYGLRSQGDLQKGHTVLVQSAAGGCGQFAMAICGAVGAKPIATVGSQSKVGYLMQRFPWLTAEQIIVRDPTRCLFPSLLTRILMVPAVY